MHQQGFLTMTDQIKNTIVIKVQPEKMYAYVTQPWLWHEWHPNSKSAKAKVSELLIGDTFDEVIELKPLSPLPIKIKKQAHYKVLIDDPAHHWQVEGNMDGGWVQIDYQFNRSDSGVEFTRTLSYETKGINRTLAPFLKPRMREMSLVALSNLKQKLEQMP